MVESSNVESPETAKAIPNAAIMTMDRHALCAYAKARHDIDLDPGLSTKKLRAALLALDGQAGAVIDEALDHEPTHPDSADDPPIFDEFQAQPPGKGRRSKRFKRRLASMLRHWALIYSTNTVWDGEYRQVVKADHLKLSATPELFKAWLHHPERRMISPNQLVFEPGGNVGAGEINIFNGWPLQPDPSKSCVLLVRLLYELCGEDDQLFDWVARWLAYPLQHPGAKMATAIVVHGEEGTGKNLFFDTVGQIYGEYGDVIGQEQTESSFNDWASGKLFMIANEVVSHQELRHLKGRLKHLITGATIQVNGKNMPLRREANHINLIFLSNELLPVVLDCSDRRYTVIWTDRVMRPDAIAETVAEIAAGGAAGLYHWLLNYQLDDFNAHTKPYDNEARRDLIRMGMSPAERFYADWKAGDTEMDYASCKAQQLYQGFKMWCADRGERYVSAENVFCKSISRHVTKRRREITDVDLKQRNPTLYLVGDDERGEADRAVLERRIQQFQEALDAMSRKYNRTKP